MAQKASTAAGLCKGCKKEKQLNYVYSGAQETCVWLGKDADESDLAMDLIASLDENDYESPRNRFNPRGLQAIAELQERSRRSCAWVIQGK